MENLEQEPAIPTLDVTVLDCPDALQLATFYAKLLGWRVEEGSDSVVLERQTLQVQPPPMFQVVLLNDDFTPMEFVIDVLQELFGKDREEATRIMLKIHLDGRGICGVYSRDIANTKVEQVLMAAQHAGHPLQAVSEPVE